MGEMHAACMRVLPMLLVLLALPTGGARAQFYDPIPLESPSYFVSMYGGYSDLSADQATHDLGFLRLTLLPYEGTTWWAGGTATVPVWKQLGIRVGMRGGQSRLEVFGVGDEGSGVRGGLEIFWRDPTLGQIAVGYDYGWSAPTPNPVGASTRSHTLPVTAALYFPDIEGGVVDWNLDFDYSFLEKSAPGFSDQQWRYDVVGSSYWYVNDFVGFSGGVGFTQLLGPQAYNLIEGIFELEFLVPGGTRHYASMSVYGTVGRVEEQDLPSPFTTASQSSWRIGVQASVHFPGVASLVELNRAYR
jgi:hypothetical protein